MNFKYGDEHPTRAGWRFMRYKKSANGEVAIGRSGEPLIQWCSPQAWANIKVRSKVDSQKHYRKYREAVKARTAAHTIKVRETMLAAKDSETRRKFLTHKRWLAIKCKSALRSIPFDLPEDFFATIPDVCAALGTPLDKTSSRKENSPTVDKVLWKSGYVRGNVAWISGRANRMKRDASVEEILRIITFLEQFGSGQAARSAVLPVAAAKAKSYRSNLLGKSKRKGVPFDLPLEFFTEVPTACPMLGTPLGPFGKQSNSPSVDRIIPARGYVVGNAVWVSRRANEIKRDASVEELRKIVAYIRRFTTGQHIE